MKQHFFLLISLNVVNYFVCDVLNAFKVSPYFCQRSVSWAPCSPCCVSGFLWIFHLHKQKERYDSRSV